MELRSHICKSVSILETILKHAMTDGNGIYNKNNKFVN